MFPSIIRGNESQAAESVNRWWVMGHFMPPGISQTSEFEIRFWRYESQPDYGQKTFQGVEFILVEHGVLRIELEFTSDSEVPQTETVILNGVGREYVIIPPGYKKRIFVSNGPVWGLTVRSPSSPGVNKVLEKPSYKQ